MDSEKTGRTVKKPTANKTTAKKQTIIIRWMGGVDRPFLYLLLVLLAFGTVMVFTSSYAYAQSKFGDSYYFSKSQIFFIALGLLVMMCVIKFGKRELVMKLTPIVYYAVLLLNAAVLVFGYIGLGAKRWIVIGGVNFQPSELLKIMTVVYCARWAALKQDKMRTFRYGFLPFAAMMAVSVGILILQNHLSAAIITFTLVFCMMILGGTNGKLLIFLSAVGGAAVTYVVTHIQKIIDLLSKSENIGHAAKRLLIWQDPIKYMRDEATGWGGWQPSQSLFAISSGGFWGVGLGQSMQKHGYLPEPQNDYIFAILCEELGFVGAFAAIALFAALIIRGFIIAKNCKDRFGQLIVAGLMTKLALQVILNIAVVTNTIPSTGISLPFFSYGGTALLISLAEMGLVLSISKYSYTERGEIE